VVKVYLCVIGDWKRENAVRRYGQSSKGDGKFVVALDKCWIVLVR